MSRFGNRVLWGGGAALLAFAIGGPVLAAVAWKGVGFAVTGNPLHLIPGGGLLSDGADAVGAIADMSSAVADTGSTFVDAADAHSSAAELASHYGASTLADGAPNIQGVPSNLDIHGNPPMDGQGNEWGRLGNGGYPTDIVGNRT